VDAGAVEVPPRIKLTDRRSSPKPAELLPRRRKLLVFSVLGLHPKEREYKRRVTHPLDHFLNVLAAIWPAIENCIPILEGFDLFWRWREARTQLIANLKSAFHAKRRPALFAISLSDPGQTEVDFNQKLPCGAFGLFGLHSH
jgi:hypothetical protein